LKNWVEKSRGGDRRSEKLKKPNNPGGQKKKDMKASKKIIPGAKLGGKV